MKDLRIPITPGFTIQLGSVSYTISTEAGRGSSCIVYNAHYQDLVGEQHKVMIKECYPVRIAICRNPESMELTAENENSFKQQQDGFISSYKKQVSFRENISLLTNSTSDSRNIYEANQTKYIILSSYEAENYLDFQENSLKKLFLRMQTLCCILGTYHEHGYLYLDIKPENILVNGNSTQQLMLFDFDSVISMEELRNSSHLCLHYTNDYAPWEVKHGNFNAINKTADVFSIGAVIFFKIFGHVPSDTDKKTYSTYDFSTLPSHFLEKDYQPKFYRELTTLFRKTLASNASSRYPDMKCVEVQLSRLISLLNPENIHLTGEAFSSISGFCGRKEELQEIHRKLQRKPYLFLSGIGGIGKTELAQVYAEKSRDFYNRILFLPFENSFMDTINSDSLTFTGPGLTPETCPDDKLSYMKNNLQSDDLILLDNFDGDPVILSDEFHKFRKIPCKFLITTRDDFTDLGLEQMYIDTMNEEDLLSIFRNYNKRNYSENEQQVILQIFSHLENHTMSVDLVSKYLRVSRKLPSLFFQELLDKEKALKQTEHILHRKDCKSRNDMIKDHIRALFDLSAFNDCEREFMNSLSLLGPVRISRHLFFQLYPAPDRDNCLKQLIAAGWIQTDSSGNKISLHQLILDLIYQDLMPGVEDCPQMTKQMLIYMNAKLKSRLEKDTRKKIASCFVERLHPTDNPTLAQVYLAYYEKIRKDKTYLASIAEICEQKNDSVSLYIRIRLRLATIHLLQKHYQDPLFEIKDLDSITGEFYETLTVYLTEIDNFLECLPDDPLPLRLEIIQSLVQFVHNFCSYHFIHTIEPETGLCKILHTAAIRLNETIDILEKAPRPATLQEQVYRYAVDFYYPDNFSMLEISSVLGSAWRAALYSEKLAIVKGENAPLIEPCTISYQEAGTCALKEKEYKAALTFFQKSLDLDEPDAFPPELYENMAECYMGMGNDKEAEKKLEQAKSFLEQMNLDSSDLKLKLLDLYISSGNKTKADKMFQELSSIDYSQQNDIQDQDYILEQTIKLCIKKAQYEHRELTRREAEFLKKHLDQLLENHYLCCCGAAPYLSFFHFAVSSSFSEACHWLFSVAEAFRKDCSYTESATLYEVLYHTRNLEIQEPELYIAVLLGYANALFEEKQEPCKTSEQLCMMAASKLNSDLPSCRILTAYLKKTILTITFYDAVLYSEEEIKAAENTCEYSFLTAYKVKNIANFEEIAALWLSAYQDTMLIEDHSNASLCLEKAQNILDTHPLDFSFSKRISIYRNIIDLNYKPENRSTRLSYARKLLLLFKGHKTEAKEYLYLSNYLSDIFYKASMPQEAVSLQLLALCIAAHRPPAEFFRNPEHYLCPDSLKELFEAVRLIPDNAFPETDLDLVVSILDSICIYCSTNKMLEPCKKYCKKLADSYKNKYLEEK